MTQEIVDIIIIGGGPVGLFTAFYAGLRQASVKIIETLPQLGGQPGMLYPEKMVYDIPAFPEITAGDLVENLKKQLERFPETQYCLEEEALELNKTDFGYEVVTSKQTHLDLVKEDVVVGISASGRTPYVAAGLAYANEVGCFTGAISNSPNALISNIASVGIEAITGPEVVTGSTRMKAGTAQKIILNMITTTAMIQVGKIFKGYMVDVQPTNLKLKQRATNILSKITNLSSEDARSVLEENDFDLKVAIISQIHHISAKEAEQLLQANQMNIVKAMKNKEA